MTEDKEAFLDRWSRLKQTPPEAKPDVPQEARKEEPAPPLPPIEDLRPDSDFRPFMGAKVDPETRRSALKKLFTDAHYNIPDPFEAYSEDYTQEAPISPEMLKTLNQAKKLIFDEPEKVAQAQAENPENPQPQPPPQLEPDPKDVPGKQDA